jgi:tetratricopeptide (TPR) repeat protein
MREIQTLVERLRQLLAAFEAQSEAAGVELPVEARDLCRQILPLDRAAILPVVSALHELGNRLGKAGRHTAALAATRGAVELRRELAAADRVTFLPDLATSLIDLAGMLRAVGRRTEAMTTTQEAVDVYRELAAANRAAFLPNLAASLYILGLRLGDVGRRAEALAAMQEAAEIHRELAAANRAAFLPDLATSLNNLGIRLSEVGRRAEALAAAQEALELYREQAAAKRAAFMPDLAMCLNNLGIRLSEVGRRAEALAAAQEAVELRRELAAANRAAFLPDLAMSLNNLGIGLSEVGRRAEALAAAQEAVELRRELAAANRAAFLPDLAMSLNNLGAMLSEVGRRAEALAAAQEAAELRRELAAANRAAFLPDLAKSLNNLVRMLSEVGRRAEAVGAAQEAVELHRELAAANRAAFLPDLAISLHNLVRMLSEVGRSAEALAAAREAAELHRELPAANLAAFLPDLATSLNNLHNRLSEVGRRAEALTATQEAAEMWRECAAIILEMAPSNPAQWCRLARLPTLVLGTPSDLENWHLKLLRVLFEHRELAYSAEHAALFLTLQAEVSGRAWALLGSLGPQHAALFERVVVEVIAMMQSPDLARWLQIPGEVGGSGVANDGTAKLAQLKQNVMEADQVLEVMMRRTERGVTLDHGKEGGSPALQATLISEQIQDQRHAVERARAAFRAERQRLMETDERFRSAFELPDMQALRAAARHANASAALCLLQLPTEDDASPHTVGVLIDATGKSVRLLQFDGLHETVQHLANYEPAKDQAPGRSTVLRRSDAEPRPQSTERAPKFEDLDQQLRERFWQVLERARQDAAKERAAEQNQTLASQATERLHICGHGLLQQLPLGLRGEQDCAGLQVLAWPGLPYLRLAAARSREQTAIAQPWLIGHDCAWASEQPLPMVAVEAALLRSLLQQHGQAVQPIGQAGEVPAASAGLVACCHGVRRQEHFESALALGAGTEPLSVRAIVQRRLGPALALLPACHAGETHEDSAGNALGVAAGFLLGGSRVVAASSKAVRDVLMPWLSTLTVWHVLNGAGAQQAAQRAREQFGKGEFPQAYRSWLQQALPQALATLQPGGSEYAAMSRSVDGVPALREVLGEWPWGGDALGLLSEDAATRQRASEDLARQVLQAREDWAAELPQALHEMAAFVFVYGAD